MLGLPVPQKIQIVRRVIDDGYDVTEAKLCSVNASARNGKPLLYSIPCSYLSLCFAVIAKNICEVKLQRSVVRRQAGRPDRELKQEVEVHHYQCS